MIPFAWLLLTCLYYTHGYYGDKAKTLWCWLLSIIKLGPNEFTQYFCLLFRLQRAHTSALTVCTASVPKRRFEKRRGIFSQYIYCTLCTKVLNIFNVFCKSVIQLQCRQSLWAHLTRCSIFVRDDCNNCVLVLVTAHNIRENMQVKIFVGPCEHLYFYTFAAKIFCQWQFVARKGSRYSTLQKCLLHLGWI